MKWKLIQLLSELLIRTPYFGGIDNYEKAGGSSGGSGVGGSGSGGGRSGSSGGDGRSVSGACR